MSDRTFTLDELEQIWNKQADEFNQWGSLGLDEMIEFAQEEILKIRGEYICKKCGLRQDPYKEKIDF